MEAAVSTFPEVRDVTSVFHPDGDPDRHFSKHHPQGQTVHPVTITAGQWVPSRQLMI